MNPLLPVPCSAWLLPLLGLVWANSATAQVGLPGSVPVLTLRPAVVISMPTEAGKVYQMQASADLTSWADSGDPVFGTGSPLEQPLASAGQQFFRLKVLTEPAMGLAPWSPAGQSFQLNDGIRVLRYTFGSNGDGSWQIGPLTKSFTWTWHRPGMAEGRAELSFAGTARESLQLQFSAPQCGRFTRRSFSGSLLEESDAGSFGPTPATSSIPMVPASILGRSLSLCDHPGGSSLTLSSTNGGSRQLEGVSTTFSGNWLVTGTSTARLMAHFGPTHGEDYQFVFTGPQTGRFTRQTFTEGLFRDEDEGTFCLGNSP